MTPARKAAAPKKKAAPKMKAKDLAFIRTYADSFAWACLALEGLAELGVVNWEEASDFRNVAIKVVRVARQDPKFVGRSVAVRELERKMSLR